MKKTTLVFITLFILITLSSCSSQTSIQSSSLTTSYISSTSTSSIESSSTIPSKGEALIPVEVIESTPSSNEAENTVPQTTTSSASSNEIVYLNIGDTGTDTLGLSVTLQSLTRNVNQDMTVFSISYSLQNETSSIINEGYFRAYFPDGTSEIQMGAFNEVAPGESVSKQYDFEVKGDKELLSMQYHYMDDDSMKKDIHSEELWSDALNWK